ncbi:MAG: hypothetical protein HZA19_05255 [Nitrospirae bacterium]|nr:hypothetical protein [Nitrospirota bacterium]
MVILLFFFYFRGKDLTWQYLQKGVVERSVMPLLPPEYTEAEKKSVQKTLDDFFDDIRNQRIDPAKAKSAIDVLTQATADSRLDRNEVDQILKSVQEARKE